MEILDIVNDWRARVAGGLEVAIMLWERCCIPSLLYGAGTWVNISAGTVNRLNKLQNWFLRMVMQVGQGAPLTSLGWESGCMNMGLRVALEKIMMIHHIRSLGENSIARKVYEEQKSKNWPGLAKETALICEELKIENVNETLIPKNEYRKIVMKACQMKDEETLTTQAEGKSKCEKIMKNNYGMKEYFQNNNIHEARQLFRTRTMMQPFAGNYSHNKAYQRTNWLCRCGTSREEEGHLVRGECSLYRDIWEKYNSLESDTELAGFFGEVLARRDGLDEMDSGGGATSTTATDASLAGGNSSEPVCGGNPS